MSPSERQTVLLQPRLEPSPIEAAGPSERQSHIEHQAALDATVFRAGAASRELVLELEAGELRLRRLAAATESR